MAKTPSGPIFAMTDRGGMRRISKGVPHKGRNYRVSECTKCHQLLVTLPKRGRPTTVCPGCKRGDNKPAAPAAAPQAAATPALPA